MPQNITIRSSKCSFSPLRQYTKSYWDMWIHTLCGCSSNCQTGNKVHDQPCRGRNIRTLARRQYWYSLTTPWEVTETENNFDSW